MVLDPYASCPGGAAKKIKFCCPDLVTELDKLERMLQGDQRAAALEFVEASLRKHPDRACLLSFKAMLESELKSVGAAEATAAHMLELYPDNPVALAELAIISSAKSDALGAVDYLQKAFDGLGQDDVPHQVYSATGLVADRLLRGGYYLAARGHLLMQLAFSQGQDEQVLNLLSRINMIAEIPLLLKQEFNLDLPETEPDRWPVDPASKAACKAAIEAGFRGSWRKAADQLAAIGQTAGAWPGIERNQAILRGWVADHPAACAAWRALAASPRVSEDEAAEALALASLLDPETVDQTGIFRRHYPVKDFEALSARLFAHAQTPRMPYDLSQFSGPDEPAPKGAFFLLDRPMPSAEAPSDGGPPDSIALGEIPRIVGQVFLYSRETDRDARLEMIAYGDEREAAHRTLSLAAGDAIGVDFQEEQTGDVPTWRHLLSWNLRLPEKTSTERRIELLDAERREAVLERWPQRPLRELAGKTPLEAAQDPAARARLLAAILVIESSPENSMSDLDFDLLREKLGLGPAALVDASQFVDGAVPLPRLSRVALDKLDDESLFENLNRAVMMHHHRALRRFASELVRRPSVPLERKSLAHGMLAQIEIDPHKALWHVDAARKAAEAAGQSSAAWDVTELSLRLAANDIEASQRLMLHIQAEHINERGVKEALFRVLVEAGVIGPDGQMPVAAAKTPAGSGLIVPGAASASSETSGGGKLWTPGAEPAQGAKKSAIWTPGS